jgi:replicative DNA helicase
MTDARTQPWSEESERTVNGAILVHPRKLVEVLPFVGPEDFFHPSLRYIFQAMVDLDAAAKPVDAATVVDQMRASGTFDRLNHVGGGDFITGLMSTVVTVENVPYHAKVVRTKAERRRCLELLREIIDEGYSPLSDEEWRERRDQRLLSVMTGSRGQAAEVSSIKVVMHEFATELQHRAERRQSGQSWSTAPPGAVWRGWCSA